MRAVVRRVEDDGVLGDLQLVELLEHHSDGLVVVHHGVVVEALPAPTGELLLHVGAEVHVGGVPPDEEGLVGAVGLLDEAHGPVGDVFVDGLHPLPGERPGVLDAAVREAMDDAARPEPLPEVRGLGIVGELGLLFGVQVVEVSIELVEAVVRRQELVLVPQMIFTELPRRIAERFEQFGDRGVFGSQADVGSR